MKIELRRLDDHFLMEAKNDVGTKILMDGSPTEGGKDAGFRPRQMLIAALGGCSTIDIVLILKKQKLNPRDLKVTLEAKSEKRETYSDFTDIHAHFDLYGDIPENKAARAIKLSMEKYCSVAKTLEHTATITYSFEIHP